MDRFDEYYCLTQRPAAEKRDREHRQLLKHAAEYQRQQNPNRSLRERLIRGWDVLLHIIESRHHQQEIPCANASGRTEITREHG